MHSVRAVVRPLSINVKKRARRRFTGDRPCCHLSALCNLNLLQNDTLKQKGFSLPVQREERSKRNCESLGAHIIHLGS